MKTIAELDRKGKIELLQRIKEGKIDHSKLKKHSKVITGARDFFYLMMMSFSVIDDNEEIIPHVFLDDEAEKEVKEWFEGMTKEEEHSCR